MKRLKKLFRFFKLYGIERTFIKAVGRKRIIPLIKFPIVFKWRQKRNIAIIGAGQFSFSTIGYYLRKNNGNCIVGIYDVNEANSKSFAKYYNTKAFSNAFELINLSDVELVYIASNHFSHTEYAIMSLKAGKKVFIEKPISVNHKQFDQLLSTKNDSEIYVGYNRPLSPAIKTIKEFLISNKRTPLTLSCFITGHKLSKNHWYRHPQEGTRICGNLGHWIDLSIHILNIIGLPKKLKIHLISSNVNEPDDNLSIVLTSSEQDLISITLSSREEPFEGINESINIQYSNVIAKIDDFRRMSIWDSDKLIKSRYFRKNVGHENSVMQPFVENPKRDFNEIEISTRLMLDITESIIKNRDSFEFKI